MPAPKHEQLTFPEPIPKPKVVVEAVPEESGEKLLDTNPPMTQEQADELDRLMDLHGNVTIALGEMGLKRLPEDDTPVFAAPEEEQPKPLPSTSPERRREIAASKGVELTKDLRRRPRTPADRRAADVTPDSEWNLR